MKVLFLNKRLLFPTDSGGKVRTLNVIRYLARDHDVTYLCNVQQGEQKHLPAMRDLGLRVIALPWRETPRNSIRFCGDLAANLFSSRPFTVMKDLDQSLRREASRLIETESFDLIVCDFMQMALNVIGLAGPPRVLFTHNVEAEIFQRHATAGSGWLRRRYMTHQWKKMRQFESQAGNEFDSVIAVSNRDRRTFEEEYGWKHVHVIDTAVDTEVYQPMGTSETANSLIFVGSMDWLPNIDGVRFFARDIWPRIRADHPNATFQIVGRNPAASIRLLHGHDGIEVAANVPDVRPFLATASVVVVPLLVGGGTRLKIFQAMAMEKAVVSTKLGAEGLKVRPGEHLELADDPNEFADCVNRLLADSSYRRRLAVAAREHVHAKFTAHMVAQQFEAICQQVTSRMDV